MLEFEIDTFGLKSDVWKSDEDVKPDYPSGLDKHKHLSIQIEGLRGAAEDLLKHIRSNNQLGVNEALYCALIRLIQIADNLGKRSFNT